MTDNNQRAATSNGSLGALWFIAILLIAAGLIAIVASDADATGGAIVGVGALALLLALTVQAIRHPAS